MVLGHQYPKPLGSSRAFTDRQENLWLWESCGAGQGCNCGLRRDKGPCTRVVHTKGTSLRMLDSRFHALQTCSLLYWSCLCCQRNLEEKSRRSPQNTWGAYAIPGSISATQGPQLTLPQSPWLTHSLGAQALVLELLKGSVGVDDEVLHTGAGKLLLHTGHSAKEDSRVCQQGCRLSALCSPGSL